MSRASHALISAFVSAATTLASAGSCGSVDCTEKATCADPPSDGAAGADVMEARASCSASAPNCADPQCRQDYVCTPAAPPGWYGPVALFEQGGGPPTPAAPPCSGAYATDAFDGNSNPTSPPASCACTCGSVQNGCTNPLVDVYSDNQCGPNKCGAGASTACRVVDGPLCNAGGQSAVVTGPPQPSGSGACDAGVTATNLPAWQWTRTGRACSAHRIFSVGGCATGQVCADRPPSAFMPALCVWQAADRADCTGAPGYPLMHKFEARAVDSRDCGIGTCTCASPTGVSCTLTGLTSYTKSDCSDPGSPLNVMMNHCNLIGTNKIVGMIANVSAGGSCGANGIPAPTGMVAPDPSSAVTACCTQ